MILVALLIGVVLIVAAVRNSQDALFSALGTDIPEFVIWAAAIIAIGAIGWIPSLKPVSRGLLILIFVVIVLRNYSAVLTGFQTAWTAPPPVANTAKGASPTSTGSTSSSNPSGMNTTSQTTDGLSSDDTSDTSTGSFDEAQATQ